MDELIARANARLNSVETTMDRLQIGRTKVYEEIAANRLRSVSVGRRRLISDAAIADYIEMLENGGPDAA